MIVAAFIACWLVPLVLLVVALCRAAGDADRRIEGMRDENGTVI